MIKKIGLLMMTLILLSSIALLSVACGRSNEGADERGKIIKLNEHEVYLNVINNYKLMATVSDDVSDPVIVWSSSDESVATVSADGVVTPLKVGETTISATVNEESDECLVIVVPFTGTISAGIDTESVNVDVDTTYELKPFAVYSNREVSGATFNYESSDTTVATVSDTGVVTGKKAGTVTVTIGGTYKGQNLATCTVTVSVIENIIIETNVTPDTTIYINDGRAHDFPTSFTVELTSVMINGEHATASDYTAVLSNTDGHVTIDGMVVTQASVGDAAVMLTLTSKSGGTKVKTLYINVSKPAYTVDPASEIILETSDANTASVAYLELDSAVSKVSVDGVETDKLTVSGAEFDTLTVASGAPLGEDMFVTFVTANERVTTMLTIVTLDIQNKTDLNTFKGTYAGTVSGDTTPVYVIMSADIDYGGDTYNYDPVSYPFYYGTFNGRGHVISNAAFYRPFIFGIGTTGVLKNVALENAKATFVFGPLVCRVRGLIDNVYVDADLSGMSNNNHDNYSQPIAYEVDHMGSNKGEIRNAIFNFTGYSGSKKLIGKDNNYYLGGPLKNVYVLINNAYSVSNTTGGVADNWTTRTNSLGTLTNCGLFNSESDYKAVVKPSNATVTGAFDTSANGYWKFNASGMLVFKQM